MPVLAWDKAGQRIYENGLDRGVIYLPDGSAVPWSGITSVVESFDRAVTPIHFDGMKINDFVTLGSFKATAKAVSYPKQLYVSEGIGEVRDGFYLSDQKSKVFGFCYRTMVGNDMEPESGYKIHIIYNVTAIPSDKNFQSIGVDPMIVEFEWALTAVPSEVSGFNPTAHVILDSNDLDPWLLEELEEMLYGSSDASASLVPIEDLVDLVNSWYRIKIVDNGDGTWTAIEHREGANIVFLPLQEFIINYCTAVYLNETTFIISDTLDVTDIPQIDITDNTDGTWNASTEHDVLISVDDEDLFEIMNANAVFLDEDTYQIEDTFA